MAKWVIRRTLDGKDASEARIGTEFTPFLKDTGVRTVDDCIRELLAPGEHLGPGTGRRPILRGEQVVGFIDVTDMRPQAGRS